jgi:hypothetical protein
MERVSVKLFTLLLTVMLFLSLVKGADIDTSSTSDTDSDSDFDSDVSSTTAEWGYSGGTYSVEELEAQIALARAQKPNLNERSREVADAYESFCGENINRACDIDYIQQFKDIKCSTEVLFALFSTLESIEKGIVLSPLN